MKSILVAALLIASTAAAAAKQVPTAKEQVPPQNTTQSEIPTVDSTTAIALNALMSQQNQLNQAIYSVILEIEKRYPGYTLNSQLLYQKGEIQLIRKPQIPNRVPQPTPQAPSSSPKK